MSVPTGRPASDRHARRRGTLYVAVLGVALLVTVIGLTAVLATRVEHRAAADLTDRAEARRYALSAVECGLEIVNSESDWRKTRTQGYWFTDRTLGRGTMSLEAADPLDGDLADDPADPLLLTGTGKCGQAVYRLQVTVEPVFEPLEALGTTLHAGGQIHVKAGDQLTATEAPVSTNGNFRNDGAVVADVHAASTSGSGAFVGLLTVPAPPKALPDAKVMADYIAAATALPFDDSTFSQGVLAPGVNDYGGGLNPFGVYFIDTGGKDFTLEDVRVHGTLIVRCVGATLTVKNTALLHPFRTDYPTLIVDGHLTLDTLGSGTPLSEADTGANFNPPGAPYQGSSDTDQNDTYPNEIRGLVHVTGNVTFTQPGKVDGVIIAHGAVTVDTRTTLYYEPELLASPPEGYVYPARMVILPGSWTRPVE